MGANGVRGGQMGSSNTQGAAPAFCFVFDHSAIEVLLLLLLLVLFQTFIVSMSSYCAIEHAQAAKPEMICCRRNLTPFAPCLQCIPCTTSARL
jgi:hypothetical protein